VVPPPAIFNWNPYVAQTGWAFVRNFVPCTVTLPLVDPPPR
jgi:hypothetical protein